jgi:hypothetical protein
MGKRTYGKCLWCEKTIDKTNSDNELCAECAKFPNEMAMIIAKAK